MIKVDVLNKIKYLFNEKGEISHSGKAIRINTDKLIWYPMHEYLNVLSIYGIRNNIIDFRSFYYSLLILSDEYFILNFIKCIDDIYKYYTLPNHYIANKDTIRIKLLELTNILEFKMLNRISSDDPSNGFITRLLNLIKNYGTTFQYLPEDTLRKKVSDIYRNELTQYLNHIRQIYHKHTSNLWPFTDIILRINVEYIFVTLTVKADLIVEFDNRIKQFLN